MSDKVFVCINCGRTEYYPNDAEVRCNCKPRAKPIMYQYNNEMQKMFSDELKLNYEHQTW